MEFCESIQHLSEKQQLLATLMEVKMSLRKVAPEFLEQIIQEVKELEEQKTKWALELSGRKHKLGKFENKRNRARMLQGRELSAAEGGFSGACDSSFFGSCSHSLAHDTDEAVSAFSWTSPAKWKERDWWSADLEGGMEKLEVEGGFSGTEGGSMDPKGKVGHRSVRAENEKHGSKMEVDEATPGKQPSNKETEGGFVICEIEEQQLRVEIQGPRRSVKLWQSVRKKLMRLALCLVLQVNREEPTIIVTIDKVFKAHAVPLGLCDNLINALKVLANQQKDGDCPIQSIVTGVHESCR